MTARLLLLCGLLLVAFDVARLNITGVALLGVVFMSISAWRFGALTREFWWDADDEASKPSSAVDRETRR